VPDPQERVPPTATSENGWDKYESTLQDFQEGSPVVHLSLTKELLQDEYGIMLVVLQYLLRRIKSYLIHDFLEFLNKFTSLLIF
jgi:hypothetical protein